MLFIEREEGGSTERERSSKRAEKCRIEVGSATSFDDDDKSVEYRGLLSLCVGALFLSLRACARVQRERERVCVRTRRKEKRASEKER